MERSQSSRPITVIEATKGWKFPDLRELWVQRDLLYLLGRREILVRYQQAVVGVLWAVFQPVFFAVTFAVFLGILAKAPSQAGLPYPLLAISGLVAWFAFSKAVERCTSSTTGYEALITKVYLRRVRSPRSRAWRRRLDLLIGIVVVLLTGLVYGFVPDIRMLAVIPGLPVIPCCSRWESGSGSRRSTSSPATSTIVPTVMLWCVCSSRRSPIRSTSCRRISSLSRSLRWSVCSRRFAGRCSASTGRGSICSCP